MSTFIDISKSTFIEGNGKIILPEMPQQNFILSFTTITHILLVLRGASFLVFSGCLIKKFDKLITSIKIIVLSTTALGLSTRTTGIIGLFPKTLNYLSKEMAMGILGVLQLIMPLAIIFIIGSMFFVFNKIYKSRVNKEGLGSSE